MRTAHHHALGRLAAGVAVGIVVFLLAPGPLQNRLMLGWVATCAVKVAFALAVLGVAPKRAREIALRDDDTRAVAAALITAAVIGSFVAIGFALKDAQTAHGAARIWDTALGVLTVFASWLVVQSEFLRRYASRFYLDGGGVLFPEGSAGALADPDFRDFAYLALTVGMTFQVSDTNLNTRSTRRLATAHGLISYLFGVVIIAVMINAVASIVSA